MTAMTPMKRTPEIERSATLRWMDHIFHAIMTAAAHEYFNHSNSKGVQSAPLQKRFKTSVTA